MDTSRRRLRVFQKITGDLIEQLTSRILEIKGVCDSTSLLDRLYLYGELQMTDCSLYGTVIIGYYDIRVAKSVFFDLNQDFSIRYLDCESESDCVPLSTKEYNELITSLASCGEIMDVNISEGCCVLRFFDIRAARAAVFMVNKSRESTSEMKKDVSLGYLNDVSFTGADKKLDTSVYSDSTSPSPYLFTISPSDSNENSFEERKKLKKSTCKDENIFKISIDAILNNEDSRTTLMIRNIPNKYTQSMLLETINKKFPSAYDFFYLPIDFKVIPIQNKCNVGYAFINLKSVGLIPRIYKEFNGKRWERFNSEKICALTYARIQGKQALLSHLQSSSVMSQGDSFKPVVIS